MSLTPRFAARAHALLALSILLLAAAALPAAPAVASTEQNQAIDDTLTQFSDGNLQLTSLANTASPDAGTSGDKSGAAQLAPITPIRATTPTAFQLPSPLTDMGVATVGRNIFAIGGATTGGVRVSSTYAATVDQSTGALSPWRQCPTCSTVSQTTDGVSNASLPSDQINSDSPATASQRSLPAAVGITTGPDSGWIIVMGGSTPSGISTFSVLVGKVVPTSTSDPTKQGGKVESWTAVGQGAGNIKKYIPAPASYFGLGLESAKAIAIQTSGSTYNIYLVGGLRVFQDIAVSTVGSKDVYRISFDASSGQLGPWSATDAVNDPSYPIAGPSALPQIPISSGEGVWDAALVGGVFKDNTGASGTSFYLLGGQVASGTPGQYNPLVFRADIAGDGSLTWMKSGDASNDAVLATPVYQEAAVQFDGALFVSGGRRTTDSTSSQLVQASYIEADRTLPDFSGGSGTYFSSLPTALQTARARHSMAVVPSTADPTLGYVYLLGGTSGTSILNNVDFSSVGGQGGQVNYPLDGWYVSSITAAQLSGAQLKKITWLGRVPNGTNIKIQFRSSNDDPTKCTDPSATLVQPSTQWIDAPGTVVASGPSDANEQSFEYAIQAADLPPANCFQYRAQLVTSTTDPTTLPTITPVLRKVGIVVVIPGGTDLFPLDNPPKDPSTGTVGSRPTYDAAGNFTGLELRIRNQNLIELPTIAADSSLAGPHTDQSTFFIDLLVFKSSEQVVVPSYPLAQPNDPNPNFPPNDVATFVANKASYDKDTTVTILNNARWCDAKQAVGGGACTPISWAQIFPAGDTYTAVVVVDSTCSVNEQPRDLGTTCTGQTKANNILRIDNIDARTGVVQPPPPGPTNYVVYLPLATR